MSAKRPRARVSLTFLQGPDTGIVLRGRAVVAGTTGNDALRNPPVNLAELQTMLNAYDDAITASLEGGRTAIATRNSHREAVNQALRLLAECVEAAANGDAAIILSSGFEAWTYSRSQPQFLDIPMIVKVEQRNSGEFVVSISVVEKAKGYELRHGTAGSDSEAWIITPVTRVRPPTLFSGLTPGVMYTFQVRALGHMGYTNWSDPISKMVI